MFATVEAAWIRAVSPRALACAKPLVCVGGARLGGAGKTPLAIAIAEHVSRRARVAVVGHAYKARPLRARVVRPEDPVEEVGDEAIVCARRVATVVAPTRQAAIDLACDLADVIVLDGVLQTTPRAALAVLAVADAPPASLARLADVVERVEPRLDAGALRELCGLRVGLATCLARPRRVLRALEREGIAVAARRAFPDHGPAGRLSGDVDVWVATEKCALHLPRDRVAVLRANVELSPALRARLDRIAPPT